MIEKRIRTLTKSMGKAGIDAMLILIEENRRYLSGFFGEDHQFDESAGALVISGNTRILATDSRFEVQALNEAPLYETVVYRKGLATILPELVRRLGIRKLGIESVRVSVKQLNDFRKELSSAEMDVDLVPVEDLVEGMRLVKSADEIDKTKRALAIAEAVFFKVASSLEPGMTEKAIAWAMESGMREAGADSLSFPVIVASGPNSALPHAIPGHRPIVEGEPILFDWGARLDGYCSDTSRTVILGTPDQTFLDVYQTVLAAQQNAIAAIKSGANSKAVDAVAREYIRQKGYGGKFGHGLGHGTGLAVHEGPRLSPLKETTLEAGMIVTVEPGIYLPDWGGVRIENQVVVGQDGALVLNKLNTAFAIDEIAQG
jgi:Xaa-Pro aminopeptidase